MPTPSVHEIIDACARYQPYDLRADTPGEAVEIVRTVMRIEGVPFSGGQVRIHVRSDVTGDYFLRVTLSIPHLVRMDGGVMVGVTRIRSVDQDGQAQDEQRQPSWP